jgi:hypothetical protein
MAMAYGVLEIKSFIHQNFLDNETPIKRALNKFLNGEVKDFSKKPEAKDLEGS